MLKTHLFWMLVAQGGLTRQHPQALLAAAPVVAVKLFGDKWLLLFRHGHARHAFTVTVDRMVG